MILLSWRDDWKRSSGILVKKRENLAFLCFWSTLSSGSDSLSPSLHPACGKLQGRPSWKVTVAFFFVGKISRERPSGEFQSHAEGSGCYGRETGFNRTLGGLVCRSARAVKKIVFSETTKMYGGEKLQGASKKNRRCLKTNQLSSFFRFFMRKTFFGRNYFSGTKRSNLESELFYSRTFFSPNFSHRNSFLFQKFGELNRTFQSPGFSHQRVKTLSNQKSMKFTNFWFTQKPVVFLFNKLNK